jgi:hypothetical protein
MNSSPEPAPNTNDELLEGREALHHWARGVRVFLKLQLREASHFNSGHMNELGAAQKKRQEQSIRTRLEKLSIEDLAQRGRNIPAATLRRKGVCTALDVLKLGVTGLTQLKGIADATAYIITDLANKAAQPQAKDLSLPANPDTWNFEDLSLARALLMVGLIANPHLIILQQLMVLVKEISRWTTLAGWLVGGKKKRNLTRARYGTAIANFSSRSTNEALSSLAKNLKLAERYAAIPMPRSEVISQWRTSQPRLAVELEQFIATQAGPTEQSIARYGLRADGLSPSLVEKIESSPLDLRLMKKQPRLYQSFGAKFALVVGKGLLGDEMGLGKTIEALMAISHSIASEGRRNHLVICPAQLVDNWLREINETTEGVKAFAFRQPGRDTAREAWELNGGILVVSYEQAVKLSEYELPSLGFVVADEAHFVKNPDAKRTKVTKELAMRGERVLLMGGTMLENKASDLICLAEVVDVRAGISLRREFDDGRTALQNPESFRRAIGTIYLRRNQSEVLPELPEVISADQPIKVGSKEISENLYYISRGDLMNARRALIIGNGNQSAKMLRLSEIAQECRAEGRKMIVFSEFVDVVETACEIIGPGSSFIRGGITQAKRERLVKAFMETDGFASLVFQIMTGAYGHNLQAASMVVLMEPQLKPSTEVQAVGRAHRMGQMQPVVVRRLVAEDSTDSAIVRLSGYKSELFTQLAAVSALADSSIESKMLGIVDVNSAHLLREEQARLGTGNYQEFDGNSSPDL